MVFFSVFASIWSFSTLLIWLYVYLAAKKSRPFSVYFWWKELCRRQLTSFRELTSMRTWKSVIGNVQMRNHLRRCQHDNFQLARFFALNNTAVQWLRSSFVKNNATIRWCEYDQLIICDSPMEQELRRWKVEKKMRNEMWHETHIWERGKKASDRVQTVIFHSTLYFGRRRRAYRRLVDSYSRLQFEIWCRGMLLKVTQEFCHDIQWRDKSHKCNHMCVCHTFPLFLLFLSTVVRADERRKEDKTIVFDVYESIISADDEEKKQ